MTNVKMWYGRVPAYDDFDDVITTTFIDGRTNHGPWAIMTPKSWNIHGIGSLGLGRGQKYELNADGNFIKTED